MSDGRESKRIDLDRALLDPSSVFASPEELVRHDGLSKIEKIEILWRWEYDVSETCVAVEEGMPNGESDLLRRILLALDHLGAVIDFEQVGLTKQHGIPRSAIKPLKPPD